MKTRREFIKKTALGTAAVSIGSVLPAFSAKSYNNIIGANNRIRIAAVGVHSRGNVLAAGFAKEKGCEVSHVCDVDTRAIAKCIQGVEKLTGNKPKAEADVRKLVELKDVDAVFIATPEHWHAPGALMAMKAGKHVYLEKPTSHNPYENELLIKAVSKYNRKLQVGMQRRSWPNVVKAIHEVKNGTIGKVYFGKGWYTNNRKSIGKGNPVAVPKWLDWELWQGPAPRVATYKDNFLHYNWHWFYHWGTGEAGNNSVHFIDLLRWGMDLTYPTAVNSSGGRYRFDDDRQFPDTQIINLEYGKNKLISWEGRSCNGRHVESSSVGAAFYGDKGTLVIEGGNTYKIYDLKNNLIKDVKSTLTFNEGDRRNPAQKLDAYHFQNFLDAIRNDTPLATDVNNGAISTTVAQLGNISQRVGGSIKINPSNGHIIDNKAALKLWSREYEEGWEMKL